MTQLDFGLQPFVNRRLFRDHYLRARLPGEQPEWQEDVAHVRSRVATLLDGVARTAPQLNEATLEGDLIRPVLEAFDFNHEHWVEKQDAQALEPDYTVFADTQTKREALARRESGTFYDKALCLVEAKAWDVDLDRRAGRERSPMAQLKRYLVESGVRWGILTNGREWRLLRREGPLDTFYAVRLPELLQRPATEFPYFALFFRRAAFTTDFLARVESESRRYAERLEEDLRGRVGEALVALGRGLLAGERGRRRDPAWIPSDEEVRVLFDAAMLTLYRTLFALYAEARRLLPVENLAYARYSMRALVEDIARHVGPTREAADFRNLSATAGPWFDRARSLWQLIEHGEGHPGGDLYVPRYNGGLFRSGGAPGAPTVPAERLLADAGLHVPDRWFAEAVDTLARVAVEGRLELLDYADLRERQLGSIYEGLLELHFRIATEPMATVHDKGREVWKPAREIQRGTEVLEQVAVGELFAETDTGERKATGAFYTPQWVVEYIVERTLEPLLLERSREVRRKLDELEAAFRRTRRGSNTYASAEQALHAARRGALDRLLDIRVLDPAMGSGHFLVEALEYLARWVVTDPSYEPLEEDDEVELATLRRLVAERCLYGVDLSYLAVELAKLSLWLRTMVFGKPLDFLDHHLRWGNSLIGIHQLEELVHVGLDADGEDEQLAFPLDQVVSRTQRDAARLFQIGAIATDTMAEVEAKQRLLAEVDHDREDLRRLADLHTAFRFGETLAERRAELMPALEEGTARQGDIFGADQEQREMFGRRRASENLDRRLYATLAAALRDPAGHGRFTQLERLLGEAYGLAERYRAFHWPIEFPDVWFTERGERFGGGFDVVIGNPPYVRMERFKNMKPFLKTVYETHESRADLYVYFVERAHKLLREGGRFGMILSNKFLQANYGEPLRLFLGTHASIEEILDFGGSGIFERATVRPAIVISERGVPPTTPVRFVEVRTLQFDRLDDAALESVIQVPRTAVTGATWRLVAPDAQELSDRLERVSVPLGEYVNGQICWGIKTGLNNAFWIDQPTRDRILRDNPEASEVIKPLVVGDNIRRYYIEESGRWLLYMHHGVEIERYPAVRRYLLPFKAKLEERATKQEWYELQQPQHAYKPLFDSTKILYPIITKSSRFSLGEAGVYANDKCFMLPTADEFLLVLLNHSLIFKWLLAKAAKLESSPGDDPFVELRAQYMERVPIRRISEPGTGDAAEARRLILHADAGTAEPLLAAIEPLLPLNANGSPALDRERSAPIRDLVAYFGRRLTELHRERQVIEREFEQWLTYADLELERLPKRFARHGWAERPSPEDVIAEFRHRRVPLSATKLRELTQELTGTFGRLIPVLKTISTFDGVTERVVRRLYGVDRLPNE